MRFDSRRPGMQEMLVDLAGSALYAVGALALTGIGAFAELSGVNTLSAGFSPLGVWYLFMGTVALVAAYKLATEKVVSLA